MAKFLFKSGGNFIINNHVSNYKKQFEGETSSFYFFSGNSSFENHIFNWFSKSISNDKHPLKELILFPLMYT